MNQFFYESRGKQKVRDLMKEGMQSQAYSRSSGSKRTIFRGLPTLIVVIVCILGIMELLIH